MSRGRQNRPLPAGQPAGQGKKILLNAENVLKDQADYTSGKGIATRKAYGLALSALGQASEDVVALDGDVKNSTHSQLFFEQFPARAFESRIAEQNMISAAAGLAKMGKIPFVSTFGKFLARTYDQIEMAMVSQADIKIVGSHCGITAASDGPSQMALSDLAWFSALTSVTRKDGRCGCMVLQPADAVAAVMLTELMANHPGMFYMRTARPAVPNVYTPDQEFAPGKVKTVLKGGDLAIISAGFMLHQAIKAAQILKDKNISASVVDAYCIPIDDDQILATAAENNNLLLTVEDSYGHGLAGEVASIAAAKGDITVKSMTVRQIPKSSRDINQLLGHLGLDAESIAAAARKMLSK